MWRGQETTISLDRGAEADRYWGPGARNPSAGFAKLDSMATAKLASTHHELLSRAEDRRIAAAEMLGDARRAELGQFFTPLPLAVLMAEMMDTVARGSIHVLDPGAGAGSLTTALIDSICRWPSPPEHIEATLVEADPRLETTLAEALADCNAACSDQGIEYCGTVQVGDFLRATALNIGANDFPAVDLAILNPPYRKIKTQSPERAWARACGVEVSNLYAAFVAATVASLAPGGQIVAITPRSFTNGTYFRRFRQFLLDKTAITKLHVFDSRGEAFRGDGVLQENLIMHAVRGPSPNGHRVQISASRRPGDQIRSRRVAGTAVVDAADPEAFIKLPIDEMDAEVASRMASMPARLNELGLSVSTGPVVDFRVGDSLRATADEDAAIPLLYPTAVQRASVTWPPSGSRKPSAISAEGAVGKWLVPDGNYVLVRRFSAKEEPRRVVAGVLRKGQLGFDRIGLENHLNYFHCQGGGTDQEIAVGLAAYLNSAFVDAYIRTFNGHTQVNAADLRSLRYPSEDGLRELARTAESEAKTEELIADLTARHAQA